MVKKETTIHDVDALILEKAILLKTCETKEEKAKLAAQIKRLEKHFNDCNGKHINGKKYKERENLLSETSGLNDKEKKEVYKLIDSIDEVGDSEKDDADVTANLFGYGVDLSGVSVGSNRFTFKELG